jgi:membrane protein implicated in regulation of membrane protease activity
LSARGTGSDSDRFGYVVGLIILIVGGMFLRTPVLNWICGPTLIVLSVVAVGHLQDRVRARSTRAKGTNRR